MKITYLQARQILDSRGYPTVEAEVTLDGTATGRGSVPCGASTGEREAHELRDNDPTYFQGKSVRNAVANILTMISPVVLGKEITSLRQLDELLIGLDGTDNKEKLGANAILAVSIAYAHAAALSLHQPLYAYINEQFGEHGQEYLFPVPLINIFNGGLHANFSTDIQEFLVLPVGAKTFSQAVEMGSNVFHTLGHVLREKGYPTTVGDEGGYAPTVRGGNTEVLDLICTAIEKSDYTVGKDIVLGLDIAASALFKEGTYQLHKEGKSFTTDEMIAWIEHLVDKYPIVTIEDGLDQDDFNGWAKLNHQLGDKLQLVGDDIYTTNKTYLEKGIAEKLSNAILVKPNQIGTLTEAIDIVKIAKKSGWDTIISHRSGETEDVTIAHVAVGLNTGQIKTGSFSRTERIAKYNELLRIEELLGDKAKFIGEIMK